MKTFLIAEAGISHDGDLGRALKLIDHAKAAEASAVKFQTFNAQRLSMQRRNPSLYDKLKPYEMPVSWLPQLKAHADKIGIEFMTTAFDIPSLTLIAPFVRRFKIGHGESNDKHFYEEHVSYGKPIIASICDGTLDGWSDPKSDTKHLFCVDKYPTPFNEADLRGILEADCDGYSDHTRNEMTGAFAVCAGARIVEVHFRDYETSRDNLDWCVSLDPRQLMNYVENIKQAEEAVYGAASEETKKLERPEYAPRTSHPPSSAGSDPSAYHPAVEP